MKTLLVLFNLKPGTSEAEYESFAQTLDVPTVKSLRSVSEFKVYKTSGLFGSEAPAPYQYFELIDFESVAALVADMGADERMKTIPAQFQAFADNPVFILSESIG